MASLFHFFGKKELSEKQIAKISSLACNPFAQSDVRKAEMERLLEEGSAASLRAVLKRFSVLASGSIADEEEKKWLEDALVELGEKASEPLRQFIASENTITYAMRALVRIVGDGVALSFFLETLQAYGPDDHRSVEAKQQLVLCCFEKQSVMQSHLASYAALAPFLSDHSADVRLAVMQGLAASKREGHLPLDVEVDVLRRLSEMLIATDLGPRVMRAAAETLLVWGGGGVALPSFVSHLLLTQKAAWLVQDGYFLDKKNILRRRS